MWYTCSKSDSDPLGAPYQLTVAVCHSRDVQDLKGSGLSGCIAFVVKQAGQGDDTPATLHARRDHTLSNPPWSHGYNQSRPAVQARLVGG